jgi:hypothetical protein
MQHSHTIHTGLDMNLLDRLIDYEADFVDEYLSEHDERCDEFQDLCLDGLVPDHGKRTDEAIAKILYAATEKCPPAAGDVKRAQKIITDALQKLSQA